MEDQLREVDPVLVRLHEWATSRGLTRTAVAKRLTVSRPAVAGWFLALEAAQKGEEPPASGRVFRYTDQEPRVQAAIAEALGEPLDRLRAESLGQRAGRQGAEPAEMLEVGRLVLGVIGSGREQRPRSLAHRVAEVVEDVTGVPTLIVPEPRGNDRVNPPYQYQLVVFYSEPTEVRSAQVDENDLISGITAALRAAALPAYWEHGGKTPDVELAYPSLHAIYPGVRRWRRLGSLVIPHVAMSHASSVGLLLRPGPASRGQRSLRCAIIVTPPYGGSDPVAGHLSTALGSGHVRAVDVVRGADDALAQRGHDDRRALIGLTTLLDAGYAVQKALHLLQSGELPGAWIMSMEAELPDVFEPLMDDLVRAEGPLMLVRLGAQWQQMAAWHLAAAKLNMKGREESAELPWSSDQIDFHAPPSERALDVLRRQFDIAQESRGQLAKWDELMANMAKRRRQLRGKGHSTFEVILDPLPDGEAVRFDSNSWTPVVGAGRFDGMVMFPDDLDGLMDAWVQAAADLLGKIAQLAGYPDVSTVADQLYDGPVLRLIERSHAAGVR